MLLLLLSERPSTKREAVLPSGLHETWRRLWCHALDLGLLGARSMGVGLEIGDISTGLKYVSWRHRIAREWGSEGTCKTGCRG